MRVTPSEALEPIRQIVSAGILNPDTVPHHFGGTRTGPVPAPEEYVRDVWVSACWMDRKANRFTSVASPTARGVESTFSVGMDERGCTLSMEVAPAPSCAGFPLKFLSVGKTWMHLLL